MNDGPQEDPVHALDVRELYRDGVPLRVAFLHPAVTRGGVGPLAVIARQRRGVALDLLLLAHAVQPLSSPQPIVAPARAWAKAIGLAWRPGNDATISRSLSWLEAAELIKTVRVGRSRGVTVLREDGSGRTWIHPADEPAAYFRFPHAYWLGGFAGRLSLAAKSALLIATSLEARGEPHFELPVARAADWYGLSRRSLSMGLQELRAEGLLRTWVERRASEQSPIGVAYDRRHSLNSLEAAGWRRNRGRDGARRP